jgi:hypothetical protein
MTGADGSGWQPLTQPPDGGGQAPGGQPTRTGPSRLTTTGRLIGSGFGRLARVHALLVSSDALVAVALAGSLFFSIPTGEARGRVALYLLLTMAPFAIVAPIIGPTLDRLRSGPRWMVIASAAGRVVVCLLMIGDLDGLLLFPEAFLFLVLSKTYQVAKSALVPAVVATDGELVEANSRLQLIAGIAGFVAALPGLALNEWVAPEATLVLAAAVSGVAVLAGTRLPNEPVRPGSEAPAALAELQRTGIVLGGTAMGVLRGIVGFLTFLLAFDLRGGGDDGPIPVGLALGRAVRVAAGFDPAGTGGPPGAPAWHFGVVIALSVVGGLAGALLAPVVRRVATEERILQGSLLVSAIAALVAAARGGLFGAAMLAVAVAAASTAGKQAFDAIVQRDAPDAHRGNSFARFEARFQVIWVIGGFLPVVVPIPARLGFLVVAGVAGFALFTYLAGLHAADQARRGTAQSAGSDGSGRSMRASQSPGASTSAGVGSSRSERQSRSSVSQPSRSMTPSTNRAPRS